MKDIEEFTIHYQEFQEVAKNVATNLKSLRVNEIKILDGFRGKYTSAQLFKQFTAYKNNLGVQAKYFHKVTTALAPFYTDSVALYQKLFGNKEKINWNDVVAQMKLAITNVSEFVQGIKDSEVLFRNYLFRLNQVLKDVQTLLERSYYAAKNKFEIISKVDWHKITDNETLMEAINRYDKNVYSVEEVQSLISKINENGKIILREHSGLKDIANRIRIPIREGFKTIEMKPGYATIYVLSLLAITSFDPYLAASGLVAGVVTNAAQVRNSEGFKAY